MALLKLLAFGLVFINKVLGRTLMLLLKPAFKSYGKNFLFDPYGTYTYSNIEVGNYVSLGLEAVFLSTKAKIFIGNKVMFGPKVTIITGNHTVSTIGKFLYDVDDELKLPEDDQDVIIEDDVWVGSNVTILKGVTLGRGCIIGAGSVVVKNIPPYAIAMGIPAKVKKFRFDTATILHHEIQLYPANHRLSSEHIQSIIDGLST